MIKIALDKFPFWTSLKIGPNIFLERLSRSLKKLDCKITSRFDPSYNIALFAIKNKSLFKKPYIIRIGGIFFDKKNTICNTQVENQKIFDSIDKSSGVIFISDFTKELTFKFHKKLISPNITINNSVPLNLFSSTGPNKREKLKIEDTTFVILASGSWRRHKRLNETIFFFEKLEKKINNIKLLILGEIKSKINFQSKNIIFAGNIRPEELPEWYRTGNLYLHLAWIDQNANTHVEATACGLPSISSNNGGNKEIINNCNSGIISQIDEKYDFDLIDFYNPPEIDYEVLEQDFMKIFNNYSSFKKNIKTDMIDIDRAAIKYLNFLKEAYKNNAN